MAQNGYSSSIKLFQFKSNSASQMDICTLLYESHKESNYSSVVVFLNQISIVKCNFLDSAVFYIWYPL